MIIRAIYWHNHADGHVYVQAIEQHIRTCGRDLSEALTCLGLLMTKSATLREAPRWHARAWTENEPRDSKGNVIVYQVPIADDIIADVRHVPLEPAMATISRPERS